MTASISVVAFSFIVQEPSGIIDRSSATSRSASRRRYRSMAVSLWWALNTGWVRNLDVRISDGGMASSVTGASSTSPLSSPLPTMDAPTRAATTSRRCSGVVVSSHATWTTPSPASHRL